MEPPGLKDIAPLPDQGKEKGQYRSTGLNHLERQKSLELSTYTLARYRSTN